MIEKKCENCCHEEVCAYKTTYNRMKMDLYNLLNKRASDLPWLLGIDMLVTCKDHLFISNVTKRKVEKNDN